MAKGAAEARAFIQWLNSESNETKRTEGRGGGESNDEHLQRIFTITLV